MKGLHRLHVILVCAKAGQYSQKALFIHNENASLCQLPRNKLHFALFSPDPGVSFWPHCQYFLGSACSFRSVRFSVPLRAFNCMISRSAEGAADSKVQGISTQIIGIWSDFCLSGAHWMWFFCETSLFFWTLSRVSKISRDLNCEHFRKKYVYDCIGDKAKRLKVNFFTFVLLYFGNKTTEEKRFKITKQKSRCWNTERKTKIHFLPEPHLCFWLFRIHMIWSNIVVELISKVTLARSLSFCLSVNSCCLDSSQILNGVQQSVVTRRWCS